LFCSLNSPIQLGFWPWIHLWNTRTPFPQFAWHQIALTRAANQ
jgi:hypothetical protein